VILLLLGLACGPKEIPPHLRMDPPVPEQASVAPPSTTAEAAARLVGTDPLLRRARPGPPGTWADLPAGPAIEAWATIARRPAAPPNDWDAVEAAHRGTLAVPLVRGARLAAVEAAAAQPEALGEAGMRLLPWLGPVVIDAAPLPAGARGPLDWLGRDPTAAQSGALKVAERAVLLGWLDHPTLPVAAAADALQPGVHDRLIDSPTGALLLARARGLRDPEAGAIGKQLLERATTYALQAVAADRDSEQERWRATRAALPEPLQADPIAALLEQALPKLRADAGDDASASLALVALTAQRLHGSCPDTPCAGLDRVSTLATTERWSPDAAAPAAAWRVVAGKQALDSLEVTRERVGVPSAWLDLADVLTGTGGGSVRHTLIRTRGPDATTWLELSRLAGGRDATSWDEAHLALQDHLGRLCTAALDAEVTDEQRRTLERIRRRTE